MGDHAPAPGEAGWLITQAAQMGVELAPDQARLLVAYSDQMLEVNRFVNLTAVRERQDVLIRHHLDSLTLCRVIPPEAEDLAVDVGSGAGFPGVPLAVVRPKLRVVLVESVGKKAQFLTQATRALGLGNVEVMRERAEELGHQEGFRERAAWAVCRAVGSLAESLELCSGLVRRGGRVVVMKGPGVEAEWEAGEALAKQAGLETPLRREVLSLPGGLRRILVVAEKIVPCPPSWPRRPGRLGRPER